MMELTNETLFHVLLLQAADEGRGKALFGPSVKRVREALPPFMKGAGLPDVYFEFPLAGEPFLDVTVLYGELGGDTHIDSPAAQGTDGMLAWYEGARREHGDIACGFELDTKRAGLPLAAIHFQPRRNTHLVRPFCETIGEQLRGELYLAQAARMPDGWPLSFFGMFRGRPDSPLRVCGYLDPGEQAACAEDPAHVAQMLDAAGFSAYDASMLGRVSELLAATPGQADFQLDVLPDGSLGDTFAIDLRFETAQPQAVRASFANGPAARIMSMLERWGAADSRWKQGGDTAFARAIPVQLPDGSWGRQSFTLMPQWVKARWTAGVLQPSKLYLLGKSTLL